MSQDYWYKKLKSSVPGWVFEKEHYNDAIFQALGKVLDQIETTYRNHVQETFIDTASTKYLEQHGSERVIARVNFEGDAAYAQRIKKIVNNSNKPALKSLVDALLINGESTIIEHYTANNFLNRDAYINRDIISVDVLYNAFTILVNKQIPSPKSFYNREFFMNREFLTGSNESSIGRFEAIVETVNNNKAFGVVYRLVERPIE